VAVVGSVWLFLDVEYVLVTKRGFTFFCFELLVLSLSHNLLTLCVCLPFGLLDFVGRCWTFLWQWDRRKNGVSYRAGWLLDRSVFQQLGRMGHRVLPDITIAAQRHAFGAFSTC
jgi:hypothetical protein